MKVELLSITPNAEELIENAGRVCYQSEPKEGYIVGNLIKSFIKSGHESVLEHACATFKISEVSRALTHQLVRHRLCSYSQQSQRYVSEKQFGYVIPDSIKSLGEKEINNFVGQMMQIQDMYNYWKKLGIKNEDARFVLPNCCHTEIIMTANMREWRSLFDVRCDSHAQWEIRLLCKEVLKQLYDKIPSVFEDMKDKFLVDN
jgi:thymidylate synthase (FAD)